MLHIGRLGRQRVTYYLRSVAETPAAYYLGDGEAPGEWTGQGTHALGLHGEVDGDQLRHLLAGLAPDGQTRLVAPVLRRSPAARLRTGPLRDAVAEAAATRAWTPDQVCAAAGAAGAWQRVSSATRASVEDVERVAAAIRVDPAELYGTRRWQTAQRARDQRVDARRDGFDLTFKPPKSVSLLWALGHRVRTARRPPPSARARCRRLDQRPTNAPWRRQR